MGIVQKQKSEIERLEMKNKMLKRMYDTQKEAATKAMVAEAAAETVLTCAIIKAGGILEITKEELERAKTIPVVGKLNEDGTITYVLRDLLEDVDYYPDGDTIE